MEITDHEARILRLEVILRLREPPSGWLTPEKIRSVREKKKCSLEEAAQYIIRHFGEV